MKVLNLYAGIGGNRKLWGDEHEITSVEFNEEIAMIYKEYFPQDKLIVGDAHQYLLDHYKEFDFIWSSPPCQSHSEIRRCSVNSGQNKPLFPDMNLWQQVVFLKGHCKSKYVIENVKPYYEPFIPPSVEIERHLFWSNFTIRKQHFDKGQRIEDLTIKNSHFGFDLSSVKTKLRKPQLLRNCVNPEIGLYILEQASNITRKNHQALTLF